MSRESSIAIKIETLTPETYFIQGLKYFYHHWPWFYVVASKI